MSKSVFLWDRFSLGVGSISSLPKRIGFGIGVSIGTGLFITGATLTATASPLEGGETITYQWQDDGVNITGATASTYAPTIGVAGVADASAITCDVTVDGTTYTSNARTVAYAAGTAPAIADGQDWFANSTDTTIDASASGANLTFSYALTGAPAGVTINASTGLITVAPTAIASGTITITATDQYGRTYSDTFTYTTTELTLSVDVGDDGTLAVSGYAVAGGDLTLEITVTGAGAPTHFTDTYVITDAQQTALAAGTPLALVAPLRKDTTDPIIEGANLEWWPALYIFDDTAGAITETFSIRRDGVAIGGATDFTYTTVADDGSTGLVARQTVAQAGGSTINSDSVSLAVPAFTALLFEVAAIGLNTFTATPSFSVDLAAAGVSAGNTILIGYGPNLETSACTVNGNAATQDQAFSGGFGQSVSGYSYVVQASDLLGSINIVFTGTTAAVNEHCMGIIGTTGSVVDSAIDDAFDITSPASASVVGSIDGLAAMPIGRDGTADGTFSANVTAGSSFATTGTIVEGLLGIGLSPASQTVTFELATTRLSMMLWGVA